MICRHCGAEISDYASFCTFCGKPTGSAAQQDEMPSVSSGEPLPGYSAPEQIDGRMPEPTREYGVTPEFDRRQLQDFIPLRDLELMNGSNWTEIQRIGCITGDDGGHYGIGWMQFVLYFELFAAAFGLLLSALKLLTGFGMGAVWKLAYLICPGMKPLCIVIGLLLLAVGAGFVLARFRLAALRRNALWLYVGVCLARLAVWLAYFCGLCLTTGLPLWELISLSDVSSIIAGIVIMVVNFVYFRHRRVVFVN